jgi:hypothetical protein
MTALRFTRVLLLRILLRMIAFQFGDLTCCFSVTKTICRKYEIFVFSGASTIRGYRLEERFIMESKHKVDTNMVFYFAGIASNR